MIRQEFKAQTAVFTRHKLFKDGSDTYPELSKKLLIDPSQEIRRVLKLRGLLSLIGNDEQVNRPVGRSDSLAQPQNFVSTVLSPVTPVKQNSPPRPNTGQTFLQLGCGGVKLFRKLMEKGLIEVSLRSKELKIWEKRNLALQQFDYGYTYYKRRSGRVPTLPFKQVDP